MKVPSSFFPVAHRPECAPSSCSSSLLPAVWKSYPHRLSSDSREDLTKGTDHLRLARKTVQSVWSLTELMKKPSKCKVRLELQLVTYSGWQILQKVVCPRIHRASCILLDSWHRVSSIHRIVHTRAYSIVASLLSTSKMQLSKCNYPRKHVNPGEMHLAENGEVIPPQAQLFCCLSLAPSPG